MSKSDLPDGSRDDELERAPRSINLWVVYGLMLLALLVAIGLATMIVLPFYQRR